MATGQGESAIWWIMQKPNMWDPMAMLVPRPCSVGGMSWNESCSWALANPHPSFHHNSLHSFPALRLFLPHIILPSSIFFNVHSSPHPHPHTPSEQPLPPKSLMCKLATCALPPLGPYWLPLPHIPHMSPSPPPPAGRGAVAAHWEVWFNSPSVCAHPV